MNSNSSRIERKIEMIRLLGRIMGGVERDDDNELAESVDLSLGINHVKSIADDEPEPSARDKAYVQLSCGSVDRLVAPGEKARPGVVLRGLVNSNKCQLLRQLASQLGVEYAVEAADEAGRDGEAENAAQDSPRLARTRETASELKIEEYASNFIDNLLNECRDLIKPAVEAPSAVTASVPEADDEAKTRAIESFADQMVEGMFSFADLGLRDQSTERDAGGQQEDEPQASLFEDTSSAQQLRIPNKRRTRTDTETSSTSSVSTFASTNTTVPAYNGFNLHGTELDNYVIRRHSAADVHVNNNLKRKLIMLLNSMDLSSRSKMGMAHKNRLSIDENSSLEPANADDDPHASANCYCFNLNYSNKSLADSSIASNQLEIPDDLCTQRRHSFENPFMNQAKAYIRPSSIHQHRSNCPKNGNEPPQSPALTDSNNNSRKESEDINASKMSFVAGDLSAKLVAEESAVSAKNASDQTLSMSCSSLPATISVHKAKSNLNPIPLSFLPASLKQYNKLTYKGLAHSNGRGRRQHASKLSASFNPGPRLSRGMVKRTRASHVEDPIQLSALCDVYVDKLTDGILGEAVSEILSMKRSIEANFVPKIQDSIVAQAIAEASIIIQADTKIQEIVLKCDCEPLVATPQSDQDASSSSDLDRSLSCLLAAYSSVLALTEFNLTTKKVTFVCSHV